MQRNAKNAEHLEENKIENETNDDVLLLFLFNYLFI